MWQVQAILKTPVEGVSKVVILIGDKTGKEKPAVLAFFVLPDGKHIITGDTDHRIRRASVCRCPPAACSNAPTAPIAARPAKDLELVEFADFQCPHCKEAQANMDKLVTDYPKARIVFQNFPIPSIHPQSMTAAEYGLCVDQARRQQRVLPVRVRRL